MNSGYSHSNVVYNGGGKIRYQKIWTGEVLDYEYWIWYLITSISYLLTQPADTQMVQEWCKLQDDYIILSITAVTTRVRENNWTDICRVFITTPSMAIILHRKPASLGTPLDIRGGAHDSNKEKKLYFTNGHGHLIFTYNNTKHMQWTQSARNQRKDMKEGRSEIKTTFVKSYKWNLWQDNGTGVTLQRDDSRKQECPKMVVVTSTSLTHQSKFENSTNKQVWYMQIPDNTGGITFWWQCGTLKHIPTCNCIP